MTILSLCICCSQLKQKNNNIIGVPDNEVSVNNIQPADPQIIIGGHVTAGYTKLNADSINRFIISIETGKHADLTGIEQLENLQWLSITLRERNDVDFTPLKALERLQVLDIGGQYFTEIPDLSGIPSLIRLEARFTNLTTLDGIEKIPNLEIFEVRDNRQPITDTSALRYAKKLKVLRFISGLYAVNIPDLAELPNLEELTLAGYGEYDLTGIGELQSLKTLYVQDIISKETGERSVYKNIEEIGKLTGLTKFHLDAAVPSIKFLANNINLESLTLIADRRREDFWDLDKQLVLDFTPLRILKKLKSLTILGFVPDSSYDFIDELPELEYVNVNLFDNMNH
jgi:Leucine-rich repeat (LRR) protein